MDSIHTIVFEHSPDAILVTNEDRVIQSVNPAFTALFGYSQEDACGQSMRIFYADPADYERLRPQHAGEDRKQPVRHYTVRYKRKDGGSFMAEATAKATFGRDGRLAGHVVIIRDISARVRLKELLRSLVSASAHANADSAAAVRQFLSLVRGYFGLEAGMVSRVTGDTLMVQYLAGAARNAAEGDERPAGSACCRVVLEADRMSSFAFPAEAGNGAALPCFAEEGVEAYIGAPLIVGGRPYGALNFFSHAPRSAPFSEEDRALTGFLAEWLGGFLEQSEQSAELKRLSEDLARNAENFRHLYRATPAMLHSIDPEGRIVEVSDYWLEKMGYSSREEVVGRKSVEFLTEETRDYALREVLPCFWEKGFIDRIPYSFVRKDGSVFKSEMSAIVTNDPATGDKRSLAVIFDVTERDQAQALLEKKNDELERLNEELDTFASVASHDLQEPLRKIRKFADILEAELPGDLSGDGAYALEVMRGAAQRMQTLIADLLAYARTANAVIEPEPVDLGRVLDRVSDDLSVAIAEADARVTAGPLPTVRGNPQQLRQLFQNLIGNAVKYRDHGKRCEIDIVAEPGEADCAWRVSVRDNGIGFDPGAAEAIFLPFRRLQPRSRASGSGLGLTICGRIAERHGWSLQAQSAPGEGSTFTLEIPADAP